MQLNIDELELKALSKNHKESIKGVTDLISIVDKATDILIKSLELNNDRFVITELMSSIFVGYIDKLKEKVDNGDTDLKFWAACLIIHSGVNSANAENVLINAVLYDLPNMAYPATTILCRTKSVHIKSAILERMKDPSLTEKDILFFKEKLEDLDNGFVD